VGLRADLESCGKSGSQDFFKCCFIAPVFCFIHCDPVAILRHSTGTIAEIFSMMSSVLLSQRGTSRMNLTPIR
jgi:hypothetical protein